MIHAFMGQSSPSTLMASNNGLPVTLCHGLPVASFTRLRHLLLAFAVLATLLAGSMQAAMPLASRPLPQLDKEVSEWAVTMALPCGLAEGTVVTVTELYLGLEGFEGVSNHLRMSGTSATLILNGPSSTLPPSTEVAVITVASPGCGTKQWLVQTDGSGTILLLDGI